MRKKSISITALVIATIFLLQPYVTVFATIAQALPKAVEITNVIAPDTFSENGVSIEQHVQKMTSTQVVLETTITSEQAIGQLLLKAAVNPAFTLQESAIEVKTGDVTTRVESRDDVPTIASEVLVMPQPATAQFSEAGSSANLVIFAQDLGAKISYTFTTVYDLVSSATSGELALLAPVSVAYRFYDAQASVTTDAPGISPTVTLSEVATPEPEVTTPEVTTPEVTTPEVTTPEVTTPEDSSIEKPGQMTVAPGVVVPEKPAVKQAPKARAALLAVNDAMTLSKTATPQANIFTINLTAEGNPTVIPPKSADIVMILDDSGSMEGEKLASLKTAAKNFVSTMITAQTDVRISIVKFNTVASQLQDWTTSTTTLQTQIDSLNAGGGTNTQDAFIKAQTRLGTARSGANKYVVLFTDGLPTFYNKPCVAGTTNPYLDSLNVCGPGDATTQNELNRAVGAYDALIAAYPTTSAYSIGLFTGTASSTTAQDFLFRVQNQEANKTTYLSKYYTNSASSLTTIFTTLANAIKGSQFSEMGYNTIIRDIVAKPFVLADAPNFKYTNHQGITINLTEVNGAPGVNQVQRTKVTCDLGPVSPTNPAICDQVTINLGTVKAPKVSVTFDVKVRDIYYGSNPDGTPTNVKADITYTGVTDNTTHVQTFPVPKVTLPFISGNITVIKNVTNENSTQAFPILLKGSDSGNTQVFGFDVSETASEKMSFYMKDVATDISPNLDYAKNYVTIGKFAIQEVVPQNFQQVNIEYAYDTDLVTPGLQGTYVPYTNANPVLIDKDHREIYVRVGNTRVNDRYWYDQSAVENMLAYTGSEQVAVTKFGKEDEVVA